jgi:hypothetical protein
MSNGRNGDEQQWWRKRVLRAPLLYLNFLTLEHPFENILFPTRIGTSTGTRLTSTRRGGAMLTGNSAIEHIICIPHLPFLLRPSLFRVGQQAERPAVRH